MDVAEWLHRIHRRLKKVTEEQFSIAEHIVSPLEDEPDKKYGHNGGEGKNGGDNNGSPDRKKGRGSNPRCPESEETGSKCPSPRSQPTDPG